jgi:DNA-binding MarR family transcriptional regulator
VKQPPLSATQQIAALVERLGRVAAGVQHVGGLNPAQWEMLRYLGAANRYSRTPSAVAEFLGASRGTVSQSLMALERKGLIVRRPRSGDRRSIELIPTAVGKQKLAADPLALVEAAAATLTVDEQQRATNLLTRLLLAIQRGRRFRLFGMCATCRHFRPDDAAGEMGGPHRCGLTLEPLSESDSGQVCREHEASAAATAI